MNNTLYVHCSSTSFNMNKIHIKYTKSILQLVQVLLLQVVAGRALSIERLFSVQ